MQKLGAKKSTNPPLDSIASIAENGRFLINLASSRSLVVGSTLFPGKRIHKATWRSPDGVTSNQIDHILLSARHRSNLMSVRTYRGANVDSDHYLVIARIRARISNARNRRSQRPKKWDITKLKDIDTRTSFQHNLNSKVPGALGHIDDGNVQNIWDGLEQVISSAAEETLGTKQHDIRSPWFDEECRRATENIAKNYAYRAMIQKRFTRGPSEEYRRKSGFISGRRRTTRIRSWKKSKHIGDPMKVGHSTKR